MVAWAGLRTLNATLLLQVFQEKRSSPEDDPLGAGSGETVGGNRTTDEGLLPHANRHLAVLHIPHDNALNQDAGADFNRSDHVSPPERVTFMKDRGENSFNKAAI
jgi:hypothetical protein